MKNMKLGACMLGFLSFSVLNDVAANEKLEEFMLPETIITATRTENTVENVPQAVKVITQNDIKRSGAHDLRSLLAHETGIILKTALRGGGHEVMIRGIDSDKTLMLIDGRRLINEADSSGLGTKKGIDRININEIERIEIVKGPSSALYGSDAIGGVINIILKKSHKKQGEIGVLRTKHDAVNWYHIATGRIGNMDATFDMKFDKNYRYKTSKEEKSNSYGTANAYDIAVNYFLAKDEYLHAYYNYYSRHGKGDNGEPKKPLLTKRPANAGKGTNIGAGKKRPTAREIAMMKMMAKWNKQEFMADKKFRDDYQKNTYGLSYHQQKEQNSLDIRFYGGTFSWYDDYIRNKRLEDINDNKNKLYALEARSEFPLDAHNSLTIGGEYLYNEVNGTNLGKYGEKKKFYRHLTIATPQGERKYDKHISEKSIKTRAFYLQDEIKTGNLFFVPALRYDHHSVFGSHTSLKLGMTYPLNEKLRFKINYGDGFKAPSVAQLYFDISRLMGPQYVTVYGNPALKPEKSRNLDLSMELKEKKWQTSLGYFNNHIDNLIESEALDRRNHIYKFRNIKNAHIKGIEHLFAYHLDKNFDFRLMSTWLSAKDRESDTYLFQRPRFIQLYQLMYDDHETNGLRGTFWCEGNRDFYYQGGTHMRPLTLTTSYYIFGLTLNKTFKDHMHVFFTMENIFDKKDEGADLDGRFSTLGFSYDF